MRLLTGLAAIDADLLGGVVTVGNFDGVHQGHRQILRAVQTLAERFGGPSIVFSFDPHPLALLKPELAPIPLCWTERKAELLEPLGVDCLVAYPTNHELLNLSFQEFFEQLIRDKLQVRGMVEGPNFFFGRDRQGDIQRLQGLCDQASVALTVVPLQTEADGIVSSSRIRELISAGDLDQANHLLTAPYLIRGRVAAGDQRGRDLGFPTANLVDCPVLVPGPGIYAGAANVRGQRFLAAIHIGPNPTFGVQERKIEVHLLDFAADLYQCELSVEIHHRLREVRAFDSVDQLLEQLRRDVATVRVRMNEST